MDCGYGWIGSIFSPPRKPQTNPKTKHLLQNELLKALGIGATRANRGGRAARAEGSESPQPASRVRRPSGDLKPDKFSLQVKHKCLTEVNPAPEQFTTGTVGFSSSSNI